MIMDHGTRIMDQIILDKKSTGANSVFFNGAAMQ